MKKIILTLMLILCIILAGCRSGEDDVVAGRKTTTGPSGIDEESKGAGTIPARQAQLTGELKELVDKGLAVESLQYSYQSAHDYAVIYIRGNKIKAIFDEWKMEGLYYTTVYLDIKEKTAMAYCEESRYCDEEIVAEKEVTYGAYILETPYDVLRSIRGGEIKEGTMIEGKETVIIETQTEEGHDKRIWIWTYKPIPVRYEVWDDNERIKLVNFKNLAANTVSGSDLVH
jgi:hypothetical protein